MSHDSTIHTHHMTHRKPAVPPMDTVDYIQISILSEEEWRKLSVCTVTKATSSSTSKSKEGTLFDERMGSITAGMVCQTCHAHETQCSGHFGLIELPVPVYNKLFVKHIEKLLRCLCLECGRLRLQPNQLASYQLPEECHARIKAIEDWCGKLEECTSCRSMLPSVIKYDKANEHQFFKYYGKIEVGVKKKKKEVKGVPMSSEEILNVLKKMDQETLDFLKFNTWLHRYPSLYKFQGHRRIHRHLFRPENMVFTVIPVIPPCARPYVVRDGQICDDDLVVQYQCILKDCDKIRKAPLNSPERQTAIISLHSNVWGIVAQETETGKKGKRSQVMMRKRKTIKDRLGTKEGRILGNIVGKRANFTARGVIISGGLLLKDTELGVPQYVADRQTVPDPVLPWNIRVLQRFVREGRIIRVNRQGVVKRLDAMEGGGVHFILREGDVIERKLQDGDDIIFNRQPSIRLESFEHFKVKIVPGYAFRLNLWVVTAYNAD